MEGSNSITIVLLGSVLCFRSLLLVPIAHSTANYLLCVLHIPDIPRKLLTFYNMLTFYSTEIGTLV